MHAFILFSDIQYEHTCIHTHIYMCVWSHCISENRVDMSFYQKENIIYSQLYLYYSKCV